MSIRGALRFMFLGERPFPPSIEAEFDIEGMDVFSIERDGANTVFGCRWQTEKLVKDGETLKVLTIEEVEEWTVATTDDQHRAFITRLASKIAKREGGNA